MTSLFKSRFQTGKITTKQTVILLCIEVVNKPVVNKSLNEHER